MENSGLSTKSESDSEGKFSIEYNNAIVPTGFKLYGLVDGEQVFEEPIIVLNGIYGEDGVGILSVAEFYLTSPLSEGITIETEGWKQYEPEHKLDSVNRYLWNYTQTIYTDGRIVTTDPMIIGGYGQDALSINLSNEFARMS
jgi:hypothetical protein